jgi:hypothetical protein
LIYRNVQVTLDFSGRGHRDEEKLHELFIRPTDKSFGDISHDRPGGTLNLAIEAYIFLPVQILMNRLINLARKLSGLFPTIQIFKTCEFHAPVCLVVQVYLVCLVLNYEPKTPNKPATRSTRFGHSFALSLTDREKTADLPRT